MRHAVSLNKGVKMGVSDETKKDELIEGLKKVIEGFMPSSVMGGMLKEVDSLLKVIPAGDLYLRPLASQKENKSGG